MNSPKIAVVGSGLAGLTAAYRLNKSGYDVTLYEAKARVGGRVFSVQVNGHVGELGGQNLLDGGDALHLKRLIFELGLDTIESHTPLRVETFIDGIRFDPRPLLHAKNFSADTLAQKLETLAKKSTNMRQVLDQLLPSDTVLYNFFRFMLSGYEGGSIDELSVHYIKTLYFMLIGGLSSAHQTSTLEHLILKNGNASLSSALSQHVPVHLNHALEAIEKRASGGYLLHFSQAKNVLADVVILAIPCPAYKTIQISPAVIPQQRLQTIYEVGYGTNSKILAGIKPPHEALGAISNARLVAFYHPNRHVLNMYYREEAAKFTPDSIQATFAEDLPFVQQQFQITHKAPVLYAKDELNACYTGPVGYTFVLDPYFGGSYSYIRAGHEKAFCTLEHCLGESVKALFRPIDNSFFFAGEHTTPLIEITGTMEAAVESGERTARMICNRFS